MDRVIGSAQIIWVLLILAILVFLFMKSRIAGKPPIGHNQVINGDPLPAGVEPCTPVSSSAKGYKFTYSAKSYDIQVDNVPDGVTPYILPFSDKDLEEWQKIYKDGFDDAPISVAGNLMFAAKDGEGKEKLVRVFKAPIELAFTPKPDVIKKSPDGALDQVLIPVFLYTVKPNGTDVRVWKPFQNYNNESTKMTVQFKVWGDPPIGVGRISIPKNWGPP